MMRGLLVAIAAMVFLTAACGGEAGSPVQTPTPPGGQPGASATPSPSPGGGQPAPPVDRSTGLGTIETVEMGQSSGVGGTGPRLFKVETQSDWEELWALHKSNVIPAPALPAVDFSREMVIAAVDQTESSGGYRFEIAAVEEVDGGLVVRVSKTIPGPGCLVTQAMTQPFHIVRMGRSDLEPQLEISEETVSCG